MTTQYFGLDRGMQPTTVTTGTSTTGKTFELTCNLASNCTRADAILALEAFTIAVLNDRTAAFK